MFRRSAFALLLLTACDGGETDTTPAADGPAKAEASNEAEAEAEEPEAKAEAEPEPAVDEALRKDWETLCNAKERSGATEGDPMAPQKIADYIRENVKSQAPIELMGSLATMAPDKRGPALREAAAAAGVSPCPLAEEG